MPNRFQNISAASVPAAINQINRNFQTLDNESVTKTFKGTNGTNSFVQGRYRDNRYGLVFYEEGVARILIGQSPDDGRVGIWVSAEGEDVIEQLGG